MRRLTTILPGLLLWAACGGGGGGVLPPVEFAIDFQLVAAHRPSILTVLVANPIDGFDADVELAPDQAAG